MSMQEIPSSGIASLDKLYIISQKITPKDDGKIPKLYLRVVEKGEKPTIKFEKKTFWRQLKILFKKDKSSYKLLDREEKQGNISFINDRFKEAFKDLLTHSARTTQEGDRAKCVQLFKTSVENFASFFGSIRRNSKEEKIDFQSLLIAKDAAKEFLTIDNVQNLHEIDAAKTVEDVIQAVQKSLPQQRIHRLVKLQEIANFLGDDPSLKEVNGEKMKNIAQEIRQTLIDTNDRKETGKKAKNLQRFLEKKNQEISDIVEVHLAGFKNKPYLLSFPQSFENEDVFTKVERLQHLVQLEGEYYKVDGRDGQKYLEIMRKFSLETPNFEAALKEIQELPGKKNLQ